MKREKRAVVRIYVSYPYSDNPDERLEEVREIVKKMMQHRDGFVLFVPHFAFHAFNKEFGEEIADEHCLELLKVSNMLCVCLPRDKKLTRGMKRELDYANEHKMPILYLEDFLKDPIKVLKESRKLLEAISSVQ